MVVLLLKAAHKEHDFIFNNEIHTLKPGELITGRKKLSQQAGIRESTVEDILRLLENAGKIRQQTNSKFHLISIVKWPDYQCDENVRQQIDSGPTANEQPADTYKNDKNIYISNSYLSQQQQAQRIQEANDEAMARWLAEDDG